MKKKTHHRRSPRGTNYKTLGLAAAAGVAAVVGLGFAQTKIDYVRDHWYAGPLALGGVALILAKRMPTISIGLVAAAGLLGYMGYQANSEAQASKPANPAPATAGFSFGNRTDAGLTSAMPGHQTDAGALRRMTVRGDSGLYETGAGSLQGGGATPLLRSQAGALMGAGASAALRSSAAGLSQ